jgi:MYXO-CTERM domain-containing protein
MRLPLLVLAALVSPAALAAPLVHITQADSLQDGISDTDVGGTLYLDPGTYTACVNVLIAKDITIVGLGGSDNTIVSCADPADQALDVRGTLALSGVTFEHTAGHRAILVSGTFDAQDLVVRGAGLSATVEGAGIYVDDGDLTLRRSSLHDLSTISNGGGIWLDGFATADLTDVTLERTSALADGGAIGVTSKAVLTGFDVVVTDATANRGGGLWLTGDAFLDFSTIQNSDAATGGAAWINLGFLAGTGLDLLDNTGSAIRVENFGTIDLLSTTFRGNSGINGGAVDLASGTGDCSDCDFDANSATGITQAGLPDLGGGALYQTGGSSWSSRDSRWTGNAALTAAGGAIYAASGTSTYLYGDSLDANIGEEGGAAFLDGYLYATDTSWTNNSGTDGGALYVDQDCFVSLEGWQMEGNVASDKGGAVFSAERSSANLYGGDAALNSASTDGGWAYLKSNASLYVYGSQVTANTAGDGGAVYADRGQLTVDVSHFLDNVATLSGGAIAGNGAGFYTYLSTFDGNTAALDGGAIWWLDGDSFSANTARFCANTANNGAGVWLGNQGGFPFLGNSVLLENAAANFGGALWATAGSFGVGYLYTEYNTVVGNTAGFSGGLAADGALIDDLEIEAWSSVFYANTGAGLDTRIGFKTRVGASVLDGPYGFGTVDLGGNYLFTNPALSGWSGAQRCSDDLTSSVSSSDGGYANGASGAGVGAGTTWFGNDWWGDTDGDGWTLATGDCQDYNAATYPGALDLPGDYTDQDCAGGDNRDGDGDGFVSVFFGGSDCNDAVASIHPGAFDSPTDTVDSNCDGQSEFSPDQDRDGTADAGDCAPLDPTVGPTVIEVPYDGLDQNCDGNDTDVDLDGFASAVVGGTDCDDYAAEVAPGLVEIWYDGVDQNCDGNDGDQDGDGADAVSVGGADCDDLSSAISPTTPERWYDGIDQNCDGNDGDQDGDGVTALDVGGTDCDDTEPTVYPGAPELADLLDNGCDGGTDPDTDADGVLDYWENEARTDPTRPDSDGDGTRDLDEWGGDGTGAPADTDADGTPDPLDSDSDADGVADAGESGDTDGDGVPDRVDDDDDGDGLPTAAERADGEDDVDGDGAPDWRDPDDDGDGAIDGADPNPASPGGDADVAVAPPEGPSGYGLGCAAVPTGATPSAALTALTLLAAVRVRRRRD